MRFRRLALVILVTVTLGAAAVSQARPEDANRHLGALDLYLADAANTARALYRAQDLGSEALGNLERALSGCVRHLFELRGLPEARRADPQRFAAVERDLRHAQGQLVPLRQAVDATDRDQIRASAAALSTTLHRAADDVELLGVAFADPSEPPGGDRQPMRDDVNDDETPDVRTPPVPLPSTGTPERSLPKY
jgi:hypothetical protein